MPEHPRPDKLEGWGVRWRGGLAWIAGVLGGLWLAAAGIYWLYTAYGSPHIDTKPEVRFSEPRLNDRLDRDPDYSFAPPNPAETGPDPQVAAAMSALAARGDAGYAPLASSPPGGPP